MISLEFSPFPSNSHQQDLSMSRGSRGSPASCATGIMGRGAHLKKNPHLKHSMYGILTYIWLLFMVNVGKYIIH